MVWPFSEIADAIVGVVETVVDVAADVIEVTGKVIGAVAETTVNVVKKGAEAVVGAVAEGIDAVADILTGGAQPIPDEYFREELVETVGADGQVTMTPKPLPEIERPKVTMVVFQHVNYFNTDSFGTCLFDFWNYNNGGEVALSCLAIVCIAFVFESIQFIREIRRGRYEIKHPPPPAKQQLKMKLRVDPIDAFLHFFYLGFGGFLILIMLTFNVFLYLSVILGVAFSHGFYQLICPHLKKISFFA